MTKLKTLITGICNMNELELTQFHRQLLAQQQTIEEQDQIAQDSQKTVELDQQSVGRLSRMDALQQQAMAKATQTRRGQQAKRIKAAILRIKDGEFGYCAGCGEEIPFKRLELDPTVASCIFCASG